MPYKLTITELSVEVSVDSPAEWPAAFNALRPLMPSAPGTPAPKSTAQKRADKKVSSRGQKLIPKWLAIFRLLAASPNGIPAQEVSHQLGLATMNGIGRATVPIKRVLMERGLASWEDVITKARREDGVVWRAGPKLGQAIEIVETAERPG